MNDRRIWKGKRDEKSQREREKKHVDCIIFLLIFCYMHAYRYSNESNSRMATHEALAEIILIEIQQK